MILAWGVFAVFGCQEPEKIQKELTVKEPEMAQPDHQQVLLVKSESWSSSHADLRRFQWDKKNGWFEVGEPISVALATAGMAWGIGLYPIEATAKEHQKLHGDYRSPAGIFALNSSFGLARKHMVNWSFPYQETHPNQVCVTDQKSSLYNQIVDHNPTSEAFQEKVTLRGPSPMFQWAIFVEHNPQNATRNGACVFLHVWQSTGKGTSAGTAMSAQDMVQILPWLEPQKRPVLIQGNEEVWPRMLGVLAQKGIALP